ncbi:MAG: hypothetical protein KQI35_07755 [Bacteroidetes bacterium]|nr:hypothetical protein [Bacteroidota bacterium]
MKKIIYLSFVLLLFVACDKEDETILVKYRVSDAFASTTVTYRNADNELISETVDFESAEDLWQFGMEKKRGDIVYLSAVYQDSTSSVRLEILVDGKIYKSGSSVQEPFKYLTISGTVPY